MRKPYQRKGRNSWECSVDVEFRAGDFPTEKECQKEFERLIGETQGLKELWREFGSVEKILAAIEIAVSEGGNSVVVDSMVVGEGIALLQEAISLGSQLKRKLDLADSEVRLLQVKAYKVKIELLLLKKLFPDLMQENIWALLVEGEENTKNYEIFLQECDYVVPTYYRVPIIQYVHEKPEQAKEPERPTTIEDFESLEPATHRESLLWNIEQDMQSLGLTTYESEHWKEFVKQSGFPWPYFVRCPVKPRDEHLAQEGYFNEFLRFLNECRVGDPVLPQIKVRDWEYWIKHYYDREPSELMGMNNDDYNKFIDELREIKKANDALRVEQMQIEREAQQAAQKKIKEKLAAGIHLRTLLKEVQEAVDALDAAEALEAANVEETIKE